MPGEADWLQLLRREVFIVGDERAFRAFNPDRNLRFWHLLLLAFRAVESVGKATRFQRTADLLAAATDHQNQAREQIKGTIPNLKKAVKELGKAITAVKRQRPGKAMEYTENAKLQLTAFTRSHIVAPLLCAPLAQENLEAARTILEHQAAGIEGMEKASKALPRRNHREHVLWSLKFLAAAFALTGRPVTVNLSSKSADDFTAFLSLFHQTVTQNGLSGVIQPKADTFLLYARDNLPIILPPH